MWTWISYVVVLVLFFFPFTSFRFRQSWNYRYTKGRMRQDIRDTRDTKNVQNVRDARDARDVRDQVCRSRYTTLHQQHSRQFGNLHASYIPKARYFRNPSLHALKPHWKRRLVATSAIESHLVSNAKIAVFPCCIIA